MKFLIAVTTAVILVHLALCNSGITSDEFIRYINEKAVTWTARRNFENFTTAELKSLAGVVRIYAENSKRLPMVFHEIKDTEIPDSFDAREAWPECESISTIRYQGKCGSCWAFAAVEVMTDRLCIQTSGKTKFEFSPEELVSCCTACGEGCRGGALNEPFIYWVEQGIPSGGDEDSNYGCRPYTAGSTGLTPECSQECVEGYNKTWAQDIRHGIKAYEVNTTVEQMQYEIMTNGPIESYMLVYQDFYNLGSGFENGIYQYTSGYPVGGHAVKLIGWGEEGGVPYWLAANTFGTDWGENGFFRILRGSNSCDIEKTVTAGTPNVDE
ncbi:hypothetical protein NQ318_017176 [Aromia moschata]|uniref:Peptidase C1A papain C-terminal domain-containing protein n=1 Tax=Aromia moschata TaxID=1265417 RepID=A0AAV8YR71_9CUCU|nr:hypothetical protein NQ318_017176 [Aromia moschata]